MAEHRAYCCYATFFLKPGDEMTPRLPGACNTLRGSVDNHIVIRENYVLQYVW
jgi:hypothetical protein